MLSAGTVGSLFGLAVGWLLLVTEPALAEKDASMATYAPPVIGAGVWIGDGSDSTTTESLQEARTRFWAEYPDGKNRAAAEKHFATQLADKELRHLAFELTTSQFCAVRDANGQLEELGGLIEDLPPPSKKAFSTFVSNVYDYVVHRAGAKRFSSVAEVECVKTLFFDVLAHIKEATKANQQAYEAYKRERDWAEFDYAGQEPAWVNTPRDGVMMLLLRHPIKDTASEMRFTPQEALKIYQDSVSAFGESWVHEAAEKVRMAQRDENTNIADVKSLGVTQPTDRRPAFVFRALLTSGDVRRYFLGHATLLDKWDWKEADRRWRRLVAAYGEKATYEKGSLVQHGAQREADGGWTYPDHLGIKRVEPFTALQSLLAKHDSRGHIRFMLGYQEAAPTAKALTDRYGQQVASQGEEVLLRAEKAVLALYDSLPAERVPACRRFSAPGDHDYKLFFEALRFQSVPAQEKVTRAIDDPRYLAWAHFEPGARVTYQWTRTTEVQDPLAPKKNIMGAPINYKEMSWGKQAYVLKSVDGAQAVITLAADSLALSGSGSLVARALDPKAVDRAVRRRAAVDELVKERDELVKLVVEGYEPMAQETVTAGGSTVQATRYAWTSTEGDVPTSHKLWVSESVPGHIVRYLRESKESIASKYASRATATRVNVFEKVVDSFSGVSKKDKPVVLANGPSTDDQVGRFTCASLE